MNEFSLAKRYHLYMTDAGSVHDRMRIVGPDTYFVGGDPSRLHDRNYVFLNGSALPLRGFKLDLNGPFDQWTVTALADGMVDMGGVPLREGEAVPIQYESRIRLRDASLIVKLPNAERSAQLGTLDLSEIQLTVHNQLLDFEERQPSITQMAENKRKLALSEQVNAFLNEINRKIDAKQRASLAKQALLRHLELHCLSTNDAGHPASFSPYAEMNDAERNEVRKVINLVSVQLGLSTKPIDTADDLELLRTKYEPTMANAKMPMSDLLQRSIVDDAVRDWVMSQRFGMGALEYLLEAPVISEVMICSYDRIFVEKVGRVFDTGLRFEEESEVERIAKRIASADNKALTMRDPLLDARLPDGSRVNAVLNPTALQGNAITIRKFSKSVLTLGKLSEFNMMSPEMERFLRAAVKARRNIVVSGGTGTGKTTLLNALALTVPYDERIVTIEDTGELKITDSADDPDDLGRSRNLVALEARDGTFGSPITIRDLLRNALRMRPDRIIVGECRDGAALDMLQAMNTGHDGSMTTAHANSPEELLLRLENLALQGASNLPARVVRQQIASAVDIVVQVHRTASIDPQKRAEGRKQRSVVQVAEIGDFEEETGEIPVFPIFEMAQPSTEPFFLVSGYVPSFLEELAERSGFHIQDFFAEVTQ
ncbi:hypothetical protein ACMU_08900 [Actibacterium mucosum KCTC 23349]|uniref:Bacterial type II secretion system protein E domain-containing protein n=1 Tax=Actibacterium mucosum KCTC 23349 TaxID=1454373 RepID=A0A037ZM34_9RHOB|nr:ATPase, T2SS/T4P/T4SS family [Actibacterium mucosum]KAJ55876.1 hypothetical protein ACMU_08900 [Actibacterium mucosum KCTC 23349]